MPQETLQKKKQHRKRTSYSQKQKPKIEEILKFISNQRNAITRYHFYTWTSEWQKLDRQNQMLVFITENSQRFLGGNVQGPSSWLYLSGREVRATQVFIITNGEEPYDGCSLWQDWLVAQSISVSSKTHKQTTFSSLHCSQAQPFD